jgi:xylulokinase
MRRAPLIAGGAGDNAAGAVAVGAVRPGDAFVSLGTSGVLWATTAHFAPNPERAVHAFCHAVPDTWHQMGVLLSAASSLAWWAGICGKSETELLAELEPQADAPNPVWFAPYLSGERTPHNDARVRGGFAGIGADTPRAALTQAVLEGVAYALRDAQQALADAGTTLREAALIGGGARSPLWAQIVADVLALPLHQVAESDVGCALGAARLARMAAGDDLSVARAAKRLRTFEPRAAASAMHAERHRHWQRLYPFARDFAR